MADVRDALLEADVNLYSRSGFHGPSHRTGRIGEHVLKSLDPSQQLVGIVHEELIQPNGTGRPRPTPAVVA